MPVIIYIESYLYHPQTKETKYYTITQKNCYDYDHHKKEEIKEENGGMALFIDLPRPLFEEKKLYVHVLEDVLTSTNLLTYKKIYC